MRDYLYIWNEPEDQYIIASGIEFRNLAEQFTGDGGIILLKHDYLFAPIDSISRLQFVPNSDLKELTKEDIYSWGDFCWVDYSGDIFPHIPKQELAELLYFSQTSKPFNGIEYDCLGNRFLCWSHDDGWFLKLHYKSWENITPILSKTLKEHSIERCIIEEIQKGEAAYWISNGEADKCERTSDIDKILNARPTPKGD